MNKTFSLRRISLTVKEWLSLAIVLVFAVPMIYITYLDGKIFPVITQLRIETIKIDETSQGTLISGSATRLRGCTWKRTEWYLGRLGEQSAQLELEFLDRPEVRFKGETYWSAILVGASPEALINNSYALVYYSCWPMPFATFETTTVFYEGNGKDAGLIYNF